MWSVLAWLQLTQWEQSADIQYTVGVATNVPVTYVSVGGGSSLSDNLAMINFLIELDEAPLVLTTSYGFQEDFSGPNLDLAMSVYCLSYRYHHVLLTSVVVSYVTHMLNLAREEHPSSSLPEILG